MKGLKKVTVDGVEQIEIVLGLLKNWILLGTKNSFRVFLSGIEIFLCLLLWRTLNFHMSGKIAQV